MYNSANISERIKALAKEKNIAVKTMLEDIGLGFNTMSNMRTSMPKADNLARIADYLNCSVDYLLGRTDSPTGSAATSGASASAGSAAGETAAGVDDFEIDYDLMEKRIIERYRAADEITQSMVLRVLGLEDEGKEDIRLNA